MQINAGETARNVDSLQRYTDTVQKKSSPITISRKDAEEVFASFSSYIETQERLLNSLLVSDQKIAQETTTAFHRKETSHG